MKKIRSPFFYVGDKYKLMPQLEKLFPEKINNYFEPFVGGGSSFLNTKANSFILNDIDSYVIQLHKAFNVFSNNEQSFFESIFNLIEFYALSCSYKNITVPDSLKQQYKKTYYAKYNKEFYQNLRADYNANKSDSYRLYLLIIYGFNHMIRFNSKGDFNLPVGNVDFNNNVFEAIKYYFQFSRENDLNFYNYDFRKFLRNQDYQKEDFIYLDPPYLISNSEYNKLWNESDELDLYNLLDELNRQGIKFGVSNLLEHKGRKNEILENWLSKYNVYEISSNYISRFDNSIKKDSKEVYITNYEKSNS